MDKILFLTMLYDFYGELLTDKQKNMFELYHLNDLSLNEISIEFGISRQAVLDSVKRTEKLLIQYEDKLFLIDKYTHRKKIIQEIINKLTDTSDYNLKDNLEFFQNSLNKLLD